MTATVSSPAVIVLTVGVTHITFDIGQTMDPPPWGTSNSCADSITPLPIGETNRLRPNRHECSAHLRRETRRRMASRESGLRNVSVLATSSGSAPLRMRLTGSSSFFPERVIGIDGTWWISSGT